ncbi:MAG: hypothetical protein ACMUJI_01680 [Erythrobacter sp.]|uniref:hypothetical protein n=1 Tax=Erythrobacter sp. TaxID=1042 RepID=UPI003A84C573
MSFLIAAAVLPLVPVAADDARFEKRGTFVSPEASALLEQGEDSVYCLDRSRYERYRSICLTKAEWVQAIALAETAPKSGPRPFIPQPGNSGFGGNHRGFGNGNFSVSHR